MHMKTRKRFLALVAVAAMVLAPCTAFATDTTTSPAIDGSEVDGSFEGWVNKDVFKVELPTLSTQFNYILDPQGLIADSKAAGTGDQTGLVKDDYKGKKFEPDATLFFKHTTPTVGTSYDYSSTSDALTVVNKSSIPVNVQVAITPTGSAVAFATDKAFTNSTNPEVYIGIVGLTTDGAVAVDPDSESATATAQIEAVTADAFEVHYNSGTGSYSYELKAGFSDFPELSFSLEGAANPKADWSSLAEIDPGLNVVWTVSAETGTPKLSSQSDTIAWTNRADAYTFEVVASAFGASSLKDVGIYYKNKLYDYAGNFKGGSSLKEYGLLEINGNQVTIDPSMDSLLPSESTFYVMFDDGSTASFVVE